MNSVSLKSYLPQSKYDLENVQKLIDIGFPTIKPIIPFLLEWMQDINWPVAKKIAPFLFDNAEYIIDELDSIFDKDDAIWEFWILNEIIAKQKIDILIKFKGRLEKKVSIQVTNGDDDVLKELSYKLLERINNQISRN